MPMRDVLRYAIVTHGEQYVTIYGVLLMLKWPADNSDLILQVRMSHSISSELEILCVTLSLCIKGAVGLTTGFTNGNGRIWLDNIQCAGTEIRLDACPSNAVGIHNCIHSEDAGVRCQNRTSESINTIMLCRYYGHCNFSLYKWRTEGCWNSYSGWSFGSLLQ